MMADGQFSPLVVRSSSSLTTISSHPSLYRAVMNDAECLYHFEASVSKMGVNFHLPDKPVVPDLSLFKGGVLPQLDPDRWLGDKISCQRSYDEVARNYWSNIQQDLWHWVGNIHSIYSETLFQLTYLFTANYIVHCLFVVFIDIISLWCCIRGSCRMQMECKHQKISARRVTFLLFLDL